MPNWVTNIVQIAGPKDEIEKIKKQVTKEPSKENLKLEDIWDNDYDGNAFDFNSIIPMPEKLINTTEDGFKQYAINIYTSKKNDEELNQKLKNAPGDPFLRAFRNGLYSNIDDGIEKYASYNKISKQDAEERLYKLGEEYVNNILTYGGATWYEWSLNNWGTKWNSCHSEPDNKNAHIEGYCSENEEDIPNSLYYRFDTAWSAPHSVIETLADQHKDVEITHVWADEDFSANCGVRFYNKNGAGYSEYTPNDGTFQAELLAASVFGVPMEDLLSKGYMPDTNRASLITFDNGIDSTMRLLKLEEDKTK